MSQPATDARDDAAPRPRRRRRRVIVGVILLVVVAGIAVFVILWNRDTSRPVKVSEATKKYRATSTTTGATTALQPRAGVYEYTGSGTDHISTPAKSQDEGPEIPGTVTLTGNGCWTFRADYNTSHWQTWNYCSRDGRLLELGGQTYQHWDFVAFQVDTTTTFTCDPPSVAIKAAMKKGDSWKQSCSGTSTSIEGKAVSSGTYTYLGAEGLAVGGRTVDTDHFRQRRTLTGSQTGTQVADLWFAHDGLPVKNVRKVSVDSGSIVGTITYTEDATFSLASPTPHT
ncbi:MAG: hypothetical protein ACXVJX_09200 [Acidimicrobiia bacterium]